MSPTDVLTKLWLLRDRYNNVLARNAANLIENQQAFIDLIASLPTCNECLDKECVHRPALGQSVRYNCPLYKGGNENAL